MSMTGSRISLSRANYAGYRLHWISKTISVGSPSARCLLRQYERLISSSANDGSITAVAEQHLPFVGASAGQVVIRGLLQTSLAWHCLGDGLTVFVAPGQF